MGTFILVVVLYFFYVIHQVRPCMKYSLIRFVYMHALYVNCCHRRCAYEISAIYPKISGRVKSTRDLFRSRLLACQELSIKNSKFSAQFPELPATSLFKKNVYLWHFVCSFPALFTMEKIECCGWKSNKLPCSHDERLLTFSKLQC